MNRRHLITATLLLLALGAPVLSAEERWADSPRAGIAVEDASSAPLVNIASIGVGNATGLGWSGYMDGSGAMDHTFHIATGWLSYAYRDLESARNHEIGLGFPLYSGVYFGTGVRWNQTQTAGINTHLLYRPYPWLSLGVKGESLNRDPWMDWGAGLRPLVFHDYWGSRFTLFYDGRLTGEGNYENLAGGVRISPVDGVEVKGHWDFVDEKLVAGVNFSWNRFLVGGETTAAGERKWNEGNLETFVSLKEMRALSARRNQLLVYDTAQIITDTPRRFAGTQDLRPDPSPMRSIYEFLRDMETIRNNPEIKAVLFADQAFHTSFSNLIEIEQALRLLKESGKEVYFYGHTFESRQYAVAASVADAIIMSPRGSLDLTGFGITNLYFKDLLAKYGVNIVNFRSHAHKSAYDQLSESRMTDAQRESLESVYGALQEELDRMILDGRSDLLQDDLPALFAEGYWMSASRALEAGLIDQVAYPDELESSMATRGFRTVPFSESRWDMEYEWQPANRPNVALIYANGAIEMGEGARGRAIGSESLAAAIRDARRNPLVSAIVLRVNTGGGSALASDIIAREVALCTEGPRPKPIVVSMAGTAASGGYMISAPADRILAGPATVTGSIGVIAVLPDVSGFLELFEIGVDTVTTTESADVPNVFRPLTPREEERIRASVMDDYDAFVTLVARERSMTDDDVESAAQGRIWTGTQAMERGLVDGIGGLTEALELAQAMAGVRNARVLEIDPGPVRFFFPGLRGPMAALLGFEEPDPMEMMPDDIKDIIEFYRLIAAYEPGEALYMMPYTPQELGVEGRD